MSFTEIDDMENKFAIDNPMPRLWIMYPNISNILLTNYFMKKVFLLFLLTLAFSVNRTLGQDLLKTIKNISFDNVMIYEFDPSPEEPDFRIMTKQVIELLDRTGGLKQSYITKKERDKLFKFLTISTSFDNGSSICWEPHLGIVFFKNNIAVNYMAVCMECNKLKSMLYIPGTESIKSLDANGINIEKGMSPVFRRFLNSLLTKYNFKYATKSNDNIWDRQ
ncbi:hypothetical protein LZQ00_03015 [Sphingobacterium sp. SRCM116780]|uniref:hypothetical protein n=1 Tax=Sphingobacterium sp. SRCM116780 TaxID=2907623 RepID=UPI001F23BE61|nr:hypothetical protein [Sphingobacterium sp. SRCM116780]UIR56795.1 hypothetical protein LZQ00_03015 [Sphingobacterium sp. SRCM116780]